MADSNTRYNEVTESLKIVRGRILELKEELKKAEEEEISLVKSQAYYKSAPLQGNPKIKQFETKNKNIQAEIEQIQKTINAN